MQYESLESVKALKELHEAIGKQIEVILTDAREPQEASQGMIFLLRVLSMSTAVVADGNPRAPHFARMDTAGRNVGGDNPGHAHIAETVTITAAAATGSGRRHRG